MAEIQDIFELGILKAFLNESAGIFRIMFYEKNFVKQDVFKNNLFHVIFHVVEHKCQGTMTISHRVYLVTTLLWVTEHEHRIVERRKGKNTSPIW